MLQWTIWPWGKDDELYTHYGLFEIEDGSMHAYESYKGMDDYGEHWLSLQDWAEQVPLFWEFA